MALPEEVLRAPSLDKKDRERNSFQRLFSERYVPAIGNRISAARDPLQMVFIICKVDMEVTIQ